MPATQEPERFVNSQISLELQGETANTTLRGYTNSINSFCSHECLQFKSHDLSVGEKQCLLTCFRRRNMAVNSYTRSLLSEI